MDGPPYQVAGRIYSVTATSRIARARISGAYTLATGGDLDELPPKLYLDLVEAWFLERFTDQDKFDDWVAQVNAPPAFDYHAPDLMMLRALERALGNFIVTARSTDPTDQAPAPPGWDNATLVSQQRVDGIVFD